MPPQTTDPVAQGAAFLARGDLTGAERAAEARLAQSVDAAALHLLAKVRLRQERLEDAAALLTSAVGLQPGFGEAWFELAEVRQRLGDAAGAEQAFRQVLALAPAHPFAKLSLGVLLKNEDRAGEGETVLAEGLAEARDPRLQAAFAYNLALAQYDQAKKEAALANFTLVRGFDPANGKVDITRANLLCELSRFEEAESLLKEMLRREPQNAEIHAAYNDLLYSLKRDDEFLSSYDRVPAGAALQLSKAALLAAAGRTAEAQDIYAAVAWREPGNLDAVAGLASSLSKLGRHAEAVAAVEGVLRRLPDHPHLTTALASAALQGGDPGRAAALAQRALTHTPHDQSVLALLGSAWRMMGDARDEELNGYDDLIGVFDLDPPPGFRDMAAFNAELDGWLDGQHSQMREPINQSLRSGSQTRGRIFGAGHDLVEAVRQRIAQTVERYIAGIKPRAGHPFAGRRRAGFRFGGSWSSRLSDCGYHANHIHPEGWISSCYYVGVPEAVKDENTRQGWIKFGQPSYDIGLTIRRAVQPVPGRLVLFPSYMWHGTIPFRGPARTTIAFDAVPVNRS